MYGLLSSCDCRDCFADDTRSCRKQAILDGKCRAAICFHGSGIQRQVVKKLRENYFYETTEEVLEELELCREPVQELIRLTRQFIETFSEKKRQKNIVDFTDMEHFALEILVKKEDGEIRASLCR